LLDKITVSGSGAHNIGATNSSLTLSTIDASGSTGNITVGGANSLDDITFSAGTGTASITGGSGADVLTAGNARAVFVGNAGKDTLTGGNGDDDLTGGAGNDTISTGTGTDNVTGGAGVDTITLGTGAKTIKIAAGDSTTTTAITSISAGMSVAGADVITGVNVGDTFVLQAAASNNYSSGVAGTVAPATADNDTFSTTAVGDNAISFVLGVYSSASSLFSANAAGSDVLMVWDDNSSTSGQTYRAVILPGSTINNATVTTDGSNGLNVLIID
jgi:Ca2+-binding RTX toxin-like protein